MSAALPPVWAAVLPLWIDALRGADLAEGTLKLRDYQLRRFVTANAGCTPEGVTVDDLSSWLSCVDWSASTKHSARSALRSFFEWMEYTERRPDNPARWLRRVRVPIGKPRPAGELTVRRAWQHDDPRVRLMAKLASIEGLRAVEICRVHTDDVFEDLIGFSLRVLGKGRKVRVIPLDDELATEILDHPRGFIFPGQIDGHLSAPYVSKLLSRALPDGVTGHMLRHRAAGRVYEGSGRDLRATQEFLGHASVATTQIYTPASTDQMRLGLLAAAG